MTKRWSTPSAAEDLTFELAELIATFMEKHGLSQGEGTFLLIAHLATVFNQMKHEIEALHAANAKAEAGAQAN